MPAFPSRSSLFPAGALSPASFKSLLADWFDAITGLVGTTGTAATARETLNVPLANYLDNPDGAIYQRTVAATADDVYMDDRWYALTETGTITPSQVSNPENGYRYALRLTQSQASAQRMGRAQIIDGHRTSELRGQTVTFGGRFRLSTSSNLRMAVLAWTGTEDAPTSEVVNNWSSGTYTTGNFFASTTLTLVATSSTALTAATAANASVSGVVPSGATNLIVFYWTESQAAQNVTLDAWAQRVVVASTLVDHIRRPIDEEARRCTRFQRLCGAAAPGGADSTTVATFSFPFAGEMRATPVIVAINNSPQLRVGGSTAAVAGTWAIGQGDRRAINVSFTRSAGTFTAGNAITLNDTTSPLLFDANL